MAREAPSCTPRSWRQASTLTARWNARGVAAEGPFVTLRDPARDEPAPMLGGGADGALEPAADGEAGVAARGAESALAAASSEPVGPSLAAACAFGVAPAAEEGGWSLAA